MKYNAALRQKLYEPMEGRGCGKDPGLGTDTPPHVNRGSSYRGATDIDIRSVLSGRKRRAGRGGEESLDPVAAVRRVVVPDHHRGRWSRRRTGAVRKPLVNEDRTRSAGVEPALFQLDRIARWAHGTPAAHRIGHLAVGANPRSGPGAPARLQAWSSASPQVIGFPEMYMWSSRV